jgi:hypothetical protein
MVAAVTMQLDAQGVRVPRTVATLAGFRAWVKSDAFPAKGVRASFVGGEVLIDMSLESHN